MPARRALPRPLATAASWPFGVALTSWHYMWRTTPFHRRERTGAPEEDGPPPLADGVPRHDLLEIAAGVGDQFHRRYTGRISGGRRPAPDLMAHLQRDPDQMAPSEFARFVKVVGSPGGMQVGDEYIVRMPGPWNGPVRVVAVTPSSFRFATLAGHLEAGQIEFRATEADGDVVLTIESWARSGDRLSKLLYQHVRMAKEIQFHMWTSFIERAAAFCGGRLVDGIDVETRRVPAAARAGGRPLSDPRTRRILSQLHDRPLNFDPAAREWLEPGSRWRTDRYCQPLPPEPPGPPLPGGSWEVARRLMEDYEFADPSIVRAVFRADRPLAERVMLLEARFWGLRFHLGVRVGGLIDDTRVEDGREVRVWGWNYRTLRGHLEQGQMDYEVWKWLDRGDVEFRINVFSRAAPIGNPLVRLGFRLFGRRQQVKFARRACDRMAALTAEALGADAAGPRPTGPLRSPSGV